MFLEGIEYKIRLTVSEGTEFVKGIRDDYACWEHETYLEQEFDDFGELNAFVRNVQLGEEQKDPVMTLVPIFSVEAEHVGQFYYTFPFFGELAETQIGEWMSESRDHIKVEYQVRMNRRHEDFCFYELDDEMKFNVRLFITDKDRKGGYVALLFKNFYELNEYLEENKAFFEETPVVAVIGLSEVVNGVPEENCELSTELDSVRALSREEIKTITDAFCDDLHGYYFSTAFPDELVPHKPDPLLQKAVQILEGKGYCVVDSSVGDFEAVGPVLEPISVWFSVEYEYPVMPEGFRYLLSRNRLTNKYPAGIDKVTAIELRDEAIRALETWAESLPRAVVIG